MSSSSWASVNGHADTCHWETPAMGLAAPGTLTVESVRLDGARVLLVEDAWHIAIALKTVLENAGMIVDGPASTVEIAKALLAERVPDAAIVDINLKGAMSYELVDCLNQRRVPVIVVSGYEVLTRIEGKVAAVLAKPVRVSALMSALRRVMTPH